jgi:hypothetical protein
VEVCSYHTCRLLLCNLVLAGLALCRNVWRFDFIHFRITDAFNFQLQMAPCVMMHSKLQFLLSVWPIVAVSWFFFSNVWPPLMFLSYAVDAFYNVFFGSIMTLFQKLGLLLKNISVFMCSCNNNMTSQNTSRIIGVHICFRNWSLCMLPNVCV